MSENTARETRHDDDLNDEPLDRARRSKSTTFKKIAKFISIRLKSAL